MFETFGQAKQELGEAEDLLELLAGKILKAENDSSRLVLNQQFKNILYQDLMQEGSFDYPYDSVRSLTKLTSPDKKFRIYNWNLPNGNGSNIYYGFIQLKTKGNREPVIYCLTDHSDSIPEPGFVKSDHNSWYGCRYYKIIMTTYKSKVYYTLLGWDGFSQNISQKIIDILWFDEHDRPFFGADIFRNTGNDHLKRIFFKYSATSSMILAYDEQVLKKNTEWNASKKQYESEDNRTKMIVCDELIPMEPQLEGMYEYYIPSSEVYNGFVFEEGFWYLYRNVDVRNK
jgi:hypothetical protein